MSLDQPQANVKQQYVTQDAFLGGELAVLQPKKGFRAGVDSVLLGASVSDATNHLLELGAGVGVATLTALVHHPKLCAHMAELSPEAVELCQINATNNGLSDRAKISQVDIMAKGPEREAAGLKPDHFDCVIANPPYFDDKSVSLPQDQYGAQAHAHAKHCLEKWVKVAVSAASATAEIIFIHRAEAINDLLRAYDRRIGNISILPIVSRPGQPASRVLLRGQKGSKAPTTLLSPLHLHGETGREFSPQVQSILMGKAQLHW
ncbi:methyltransferase [Maritalea porphyrae]|jgi:tRNA1(Val) A37 N6-methylase TrmN6|uniref:tRNA1(Val) (adenine(37)-N6)-methyltransferase n=1 Tax=Maritalea porphyrae TaxID=880732 RepID=UPI0022AF8AD7|nr:methyltransferase [Maritalea porphyrae]MCZ4271350.1 methyltransferase [Maritalea porphyrae]